MMDRAEMVKVRYVCSLVEYVSRKSKNRVTDIVHHLGRDEIEKQLELDELNHMLTIEQVGDRLIEEYDIRQGDFDSVERSLYLVPSFKSIGKVYQKLIEDVMDDKDLTDVVYEVMTSFVSDSMSNYNDSFYFSSREYIRACYDEGKVIN